MIYAKFDQGWKDIKAAKLQDQIIEKFLNTFYHDNSMAVLINNTWFNAEFNEQGEFIENNNKFEQRIKNFVADNQNNIDIIFVYCLVDPA